MKNISRYFILFIYFTGIQNSFSIEKKIEITCIHRQVCNMLNELKINQLKINPIIFNHPDPHHLRLKNKTLKKIINSKYVIFPPKDLIPSLFKIRNNLKNKYFYLNTSISHFWLKQQDICDGKIQIIKQFKSWGIIKNELNYACQKRHLTYIGKNIVNKKLIILSHHGIEHLFGPYFKTIVLSSEHGHLSLNSAQLKNIYNLTKQNKVLFIEEEQIPLPALPFSNLLNNKNHIKVNTLGTINTPVINVLKNIYRKFDQL